MLIEDPWVHLRKLTGARIALGRAGHGLPTREWLGFQSEQAKARDAVHRAMDLRCFATLDPIVLHSGAPDRHTYLRRPDLGRRLGADSAARLTPGGYDTVFVVADGLSAAAVERDAVAVIEEMRAGLGGNGAMKAWKFAPVCVVEQGRVAIADEIGEKLAAAMSVILIGERPGLSSPESMGIYFTWQPRVGRTDAERNCLSNIHPAGLSPQAAAGRGVQLMRAARYRQLTGVGLRLPDAAAGRSILTP
jgi:ethanolamine ammonia-lyase small subunit